MSILDLDKGEEAIISKITAPSELKQRLYSFGLSKNTKIAVDNFGLRKSTVQITVDRTCIALRDDEAEQILVERVA
jgi:ferrous iron transport protein A